MQRPGKKRRSAADSGVSRALDWLGSYPKVNKWMSRYDVLRLLDQNGGLVMVPNFLPDFVAEGALRILERVPSSRWNATAADEDYTHNNIAHRFWSIKAGAPAAGSSGKGSGREEWNEALEALLRAFSLLLPDQFNAFSAARYERGHHIAPHDDRAYTPVMLDSGEVVSCSRDVACIYYLTKDWEESMGGALVDLEASPDGTQPAAPTATAEVAAPAAAQNGAAAAAACQPSDHGGNNSKDLAGTVQQEQPKGRVYVPQFNSAVLFRVPRYHTVTPLTTDRPRYSVFGWFLQPGQLYELYIGGDIDGGQQARAPSQEQPAPLPLEAGQEQDAKGRIWRQKKARKPEVKQEEQLQEGLEPEEAVLRCKLAQRLLAQASGKQQRQEKRQAQPGV